MTAWIALSISIMSLLVSIVAQHDKLTVGFKEFRKWREDRNYNKSLGKNAKKISSTPRSKEERLFRNSVVLFNFLISSISSAILSLTADLTKPVGLTLFAIA